MPSSPASTRSSKDGVIVLVQGHRRQGEVADASSSTPTSRRRARAPSKLRNFDREGEHGAAEARPREAQGVPDRPVTARCTNPDSMPPELKGKVPERHTTMFKQRLGELNYEIKDLGLIDLVEGRSRRRDGRDHARADAAAPGCRVGRARSLPRQGRPAADRARSEGRSDPRPARGQARAQVQPGDLTDDQAYLPQRGTPADRRFVVTTQFSAHASTTSLSRAATRASCCVDAGALEDAPFTRQGRAPKKTVTIRSMDTSFLDLNDNCIVRRARPRSASATTSPRRSRVRS